MIKTMRIFKRKRIPCYKCIVLARCKSRRIIECSILQEWSNDRDSVTKRLKKIFPNLMLIVYPPTKERPKREVYVCKFNHDMLIYELNKHKHCPLVFSVR